MPKGLARTFLTYGKEEADKLLDSLVAKYRSPAGIISKEGGWLYLAFANLLFVSDNILEGIGYLNRAREILESENLTEDEKIKLQNTITASYLAQGLEHGTFTLIDNPNEEQILSNAIIVYFLRDRDKVKDLIQDTLKIPVHLREPLLPLILSLAEKSGASLKEQLLVILEQSATGYEALSQRVTRLKDSLEKDLRFSKSALTEIEQCLIDRNPKDALLKAKSFLETDIFGLTRIEALRLKGDSELELELLDDAYETFAEAYQRVKNEPIPDQALIADVTHNYALLEAERGDKKSALALLNEALKIKLEIFGYDHELTQRTQAALEAVSQGAKSEPAPKKLDPRSLAVEIKKHLEGDEPKEAKKKLDQLIKLL